MTGGRVKCIKPFVNNEPFMLTYGDGVCDVDIRKLVDFHKNHGKLATVTSTQPSGRFGALKFGVDDLVQSFQEKPEGDGGWINAGFFVLQPEVFDYIDGDSTILERDPLERLARDGQLVSYRHRGYWQPMDTLRDKMHLEELLKYKKAPWVLWEN
jgi:glucose-1-phosphate cytidylyltransferase